MNAAPDEDVLRLGPEPDAVPRARRWAMDAVEGTPLAELAPDIELVVSELVTNALLHAGAPVTLRVEIGVDSVRVEVSDGSRRAPLRALARAEAMTGRGLSLVSALSREWGVEPLPGGKIVWCELALAAAEAPEEDVDVDALLAAWDEDLPETEPHYTVALGDVPTDLLLAAKAHVDNVVREFTLAVAGAASGRGAAVPPHLAQLIEDVVQGFAEARQSIKRQALDAAARGADRTSLSLSLPLSAADAGQRYLAALDEADAYARAARLLTLESPPQHQVFRRWYVESIVEQLRAVAAGDVPPPTMSFERRLLHEIRVVATARNAAERAARMQRVSAALASATTAEDVASVVVREALESLDAIGGALIVPVNGRMEIRTSIGYEAPLLERLRGETFDAPLPAAHVLRTGEAVWLESPYERDERYPSLRSVEPKAVALCVVPLPGSTGLTGALRFSFDRPRLFDTDERRFVETLAAQTGQALDRAHVISELAEANAKLAFLAEASAELSSSLDYRTTLRNVARLAVPRLADWCAIHLVDGDSIPIIAVAHMDPDKVTLADELNRRYPVDPDAPRGIANVIRTGQSEMLATITDDVLVAAARDEEHLAAMRALGLRSAITVPLATRERVLGSLSMIYAESGRTYDEADLALAEDLARRGAMAIEHATLFRTLAE